MTDLADLKAAARRAVQAARKAAFASVDPAPALDALVAYVLRAPRPGCVAGYAAIRTEMDPMPALERIHDAGIAVCLPVVVGPGKPLAFRPWHPGMVLVEGAFGAAIPPDGPEVTPNLLITPLSGFDDTGARLGYGGGFYDRTLAGLRAAGPVRVVGLGYAAQRLDRVPTEPTDQRLDAVVTEDGLLEFPR
jgi:5-formyltetrahydrofolate cyclo-ligase